MPKHQDIASKTMGVVPAGKIIYAVKTGKSADKYSAELIKNPDGSYQLDLVVHGRSGKGKRDETLKDIEEFIKEVKTKFSPDEWSTIREVNFGGDVNFATVTNLPAEEELVLENRKRLQSVLKSEFLIGYDINFHYPTEVTVQKRSEKSHENSQYYKNGSTAESTTDVMVGVCITKKTKTSEYSDVCIVDGEKPVVEISKTYEAGTRCPIVGDQKSRLDHSIVFVPSRNSLNVYINIVPASGWNGLQAPKPGLASDMVDKLYQDLQYRMEEEWDKMRLKLTPEDQRNINEWEYKFTPPVKQEEIVRCRTAIRECMEGIFKSSEYQAIAQKLHHAMQADQGEEKRCLQEFISPKETPEEQTGPWRKLGIYVELESSTEAAEANEELLNRYMYNMNTSMSRLKGAEQTNPKNYDAYKSFSFNNIANDMFTALGQQMLGGYPVPEDIASKAREAASSATPQKGIDAICAEIECAQLDQVDQAVQQYLSVHPQFANLEIVAHAVEVGDNKTFNSGITPHKELSEGWLAQHRSMGLKDKLKDLKKEMDQEPLEEDLKTNPIKRN